MNPQTDNKNNKIKNGLYVVSTPIGNLEDISIRAIDILKNSDFILCEDTRVSKKLFNKYNIISQLVSNHKFNEKKNLVRVIKILKSNKIVSIISDAGTPCISDPGKIVINECIKNNIDIFPVPGASAVSSAVSISGFSDKYLFYGFIPEKKKEINDNFKKLSEIDCSIVFFISSKKFNKVVELLKFFFSDRKILICREITKFFEEYKRIDVKNLQVFEKPPKGEITIILSEKFYINKSSIKLDESDKQNIKKMIKTLTVKDIISLISENRNIPKKLIYNYCLELKNEK